MTPDPKAERSPPVRPELAALPGYEPVQPLAELARASGLDEATLLKLDANENPFGPSPKVVEALAAFDGYSVYPDPLQVDLRRAVADYVGAPMERVVAGSGSDELIDLCLRCLVRPGQSILDCPPTFGMYRFSAEVAGIAVVEVERGDDFGIDIDGVRAAVTPETALIIVASPNNPTGNGLPDSNLQALLAIGVPVLLDEAYAEFRGRSAVSWTERQPGLMVLRTFSKWAGLAGLRVGFGVFPEHVAEVLLKIKQPYNVNVAAEAAVLASLADRSTLDQRVRVIVQERDRLLERLRDLPWLRPYPSEANFILCEVRGVDGLAFREALGRRGVSVRYFSTPRLRNCVRISVPRPDQTVALLERLEQAAADLGIV